MELSSIAQQLDEEERIRMAEGGVSSEEYRTFLQVTAFQVVLHLFTNFCSAYFLTERAYIEAEFQNDEM